MHFRTTGKREIGKIRASDNVHLIGLRVEWGVLPAHGAPLAPPTVKMGSGHWRRPITDAQRPRMHAEVGDFAVSTCCFFTQCPLGLDYFP